MKNIPAICRPMGPPITCYLAWLEDVYLLTMLFSKEDKAVIKVFSYSLN